MELDDLLRGEGLDAQGVEDALAWARRRAEELVRGVDGDPELGPLLAGHAPVAMPTMPAVDRARERTPAPRGETPAVEAKPAQAEPVPEAPRSQPMYADLRGLQAALLAEASADPDADGPAPNEVSIAIASAKGARTAEATEGDVAEVSGAPEPAVAAEAALEAPPPPPEVELDPLAGIDFDDLPGMDEDDDDDGPAVVEPPLGGVPDEPLDHRTTAVPIDSPDATLTAMPVMSDVTLSTRRPEDPSLPSGEWTERAPNPLLQAEAAAQAEAPRPVEVTVTAMTPNPLQGATPETTITATVTEKTELEPAAAASTSDEAGDESKGEDEVVELDDIEMLDDDDLLLVDEEPEEEDEVPEWKQALVSAQLDGHAPAPAAEATAPEATSSLEDGDDVDLGDF